MGDQTLRRQGSGDRAAAAALRGNPGGEESEPMEVTPEGWLESMQRWFLSFNWLSRVQTPPNVGVPTVGVPTSPTVGAPTPPNVGQSVFVFGANTGPAGNKTPKRNFNRKDRGRRLPGSVLNVPHTQSKRQPRVMRSGTNNILVSTGASLENLNAAIQFLKVKCMGTTARPNFESINQEGVGRTTGGPWTHQELTDEKVRHTLERGGGVTSEKQGGIVYGEKDAQLDWMTLIRSITGNKHSARNHEVEHASKIGQQVMIKTLPFEYSERIKKAGGDHIYKYRQLEEIYKEIIIPGIFGGAQIPPGLDVEDFIRDTCYKSCMLSRLMDIYLIVPSIQATNQAKCALNLLSLVLVASIHGFPGFPEPKFEAVREQAEAIARLILTSIPGTEIFHSGHCSSKTFHNETADWERPQEYDHGKKLNVANVLANLENEVKKLADEIMGNTEILAKFYNEIESTDRQISMAHAITLALTNYITIVHDIFGGTYEPTFRMPLVPLAREAINFLIRFHGAGLRRINFDPVLGVDRIVAFYKEAPFVDNDMFLSHLDYYGSPLIPERTKPPIINEIPVNADVMGALDNARKKRAPPAAQASNKKRKQKGGEIFPTIYNEIKPTKEKKMEEPLTPPRYVSDDEDFPPSDDEEIEDDIPEAQTEAEIKAQIKDGTSFSIDEFQSLLNEIEKVVDNDEDIWSEIFTAGLGGVFQESSVGDEHTEGDESGDEQKRSGISGKKKKKKKKRKKKKKSPIKTKRRDQKKEDKRSTSSSSKKKKKKKRKQTKRKKKKSSRKIIIDISGLSESLS